LPPGDDYAKSPSNSLYWQSGFDKLGGLVRKENQNFLIYG